MAIRHLWQDMPVQYNMCDIPAMPFKLFVVLKKLFENFKGQISHEIKLQGISAHQSSFKGIVDIKRQEKT